MRFKLVLALSLFTYVSAKAGADNIAPKAKATASSTLNSVSLRRKM
jgi:hypothetical protein